MQDPNEDDRRIERLIPFELLIASRKEDRKLTEQGPTAVQIPPTDASNNGIKVLFLNADAKNIDNYNILCEKEAQEVRLNLSSQQVQLKVAKAFLTADSAPQYLLEHNIDVLHFCGSATSNEIVFRDEIADRPLSPAALGNLFKQFKNIKLVVLHACYSESQVTEILKHIPFVVGVPATISPQDAGRFSAAFYEAFKYGTSHDSSVEIALEVGRVMIYNSINDLPFLKKQRRPFVVKPIETPEAILNNTVPTAQTASTVTPMQNLPLNEDKSAANIAAKHVLYAYHVPTQIDALEGFQVVGIGYSSYCPEPIYARLTAVKYQWAEQVKLPSTRQLAEYFTKNNNGADWQSCLNCINFGASNLIFLVQQYHEPDMDLIKQALITKYNGHFVPKKLLINLMKAGNTHTRKPPRIFGNNQFIALKLEDIEHLRGLFSAGKEVVPEPFFPQQSPPASKPVQANNNNTSQAQGDLEPLNSECNNVAEDEPTPDIMLVAKQLQLDPTQLPSLLPQCTLDQIYAALMNDSTQTIIHSLFPMFTILKHGDGLGNGAFGQVYKAKLQEMQGRFAIKMFNETPTAEKSLIKELVAMRFLSHENLLPCEGIVEVDGKLCIVMKKMNTNLERYLQRNKDLSIIEKLKILLKIAQGVAHLHENRVLHLDLKPANILLDADQVVVTDFGVAHFMASASDSNALAKALNFALSGATSVKGTIDYVAPELYDALERKKKGGNEQVHVTYSADVYSFGALILKTFCRELSHQWHSERLEPFIIDRKQVNGLPELLLELIEHCMSRAENRPSIAEVVDGINNLLKLLQD